MDKTKPVSDPLKMERRRNMLSNIDPMSDDKNTSGQQNAPAPEADIGEAEIAKLVPKWAAGVVSINNGHHNLYGSFGNSGDVFIRDDGMVVIDGIVSAPKDTLYFSYDGKFVKEPSASDIAAAIKELGSYIDNIVSQSRSINRSVAKGGPERQVSQDEINAMDDFSKMLFEMGVHPDAGNESWVKERYPDLRVGYAADRRLIEWIDSVSDVHDPQAIAVAAAKQLFDEKRKFEVGIVHVDDAPMSDRLKNALLNYEAKGGRLGKTVLDAIGDKSYIKIHGGNPNEGVSLENATDLSNVTKLKPKDNPNKPTASIWQRITLTSVERPDKGLPKLYHGPIVDAGENYVVQSIGRGKGVIHLTADLDRVPARGAEVEVRYVGGRGQVISREVDKGLGRD